METRKNILGGSLLAAALLAGGAIQTQAAVPGGINQLGSASELRVQLNGSTARANSLELKCGAKHQSAPKAASKKGKDGKCGEGKCGGGKKTQMASKSK